MDRYAYIVKARVYNLFIGYPRHFRDAVPGRRSEFRAARRRVLTHPWWILQSNPHLPQGTPVEKMVYSLISGPVWRWEERGKTRPKPKGTTTRLTNEEMKAAIRRQRLRQLEADAKREVR